MAYRPVLQGRAEATSRGLKHMSVTNVRACICQHSCMWLAHKALMWQATTASLKAISSTLTLALVRQGHLHLQVHPASACKLLDRSSCSKSFLSALSMKKKHHTLRLPPLGNSRFPATLCGP